MADFSILIAEDEDEVREMFVKALEVSDFNAVGVADGAKAVQVARETPPDLIILDVRMPNMNGFEACKVLKADESTRHIPVVFLSAYGEEAEIKTGFQLGAEEYLLKPISIMELVRQIKKVLGRYGKE